MTHRVALLPLLLLLGAGTPVCHTEQLVEMATAEAQEVLEVWRGLVPSLLVCGMSLLVCDFCHHFLSTNNFTVGPRACQGGCTPGVFGSCSAVLLSSIADTVLEN